ncbi:hypothetical protein K438DRAFT_2022651 [Mycena galopus ATCC 62051]|nr:hypothetical protein K438DRAFT_2022651 [Mycena galopus ATCC 62051]
MLTITESLKQEFKRDFSRLELFGLSFSIIGIVQSIVYHWTFTFSSPKYRNLRGFFSHKYYGSITALLTEHFYVFLNISLFAVVVIALPVATPKELHNSGSFAVGHFENSAPHVPFRLRTFVNIVLAIYMGNDLDSVIGNPIGKPMATIFFNSVGKNGGTLAIWGFMIVALWMAGMDYVQFFPVVFGNSNQTPSAYCGISTTMKTRAGLPLSGWLYNINPRTKTPMHEVVFLAVMTLLLGLLSFAGPLAISTVFMRLIQYIGFVTPIVARRDVDGVYIFSDGQNPDAVMRFEERFEMLDGNEAASAESTQ